MTREIKFRAWSIKEEKYYYDIQSKTPSMFTDPNFIVEQYTSIKDNQGIEVYEGDILFLPHDGWNAGPVAMSEYGQWDCEEDALFDTDGYVVGNINQNPDLLEVEDIFE